MHKSTQTLGMLIYTQSIKFVDLQSHIMKLTISTNQITSQVKHQKGGKDSCHEEVLKSRSCHTLHERCHLSFQEGKMGKDFWIYC